MVVESEEALLAAESEEETWEQELDLSSRTDYYWPEPQHYKYRPYRQRSGPSDWCHRSKYSSEYHLEDGLN